MMGKVRPQIFLAILVLGILAGFGAMGMKVLENE